MENNETRPKNFTLTLFEKPSVKSSVVERFETRSQRRFVRRVNLLPDQFNALLRVSYDDRSNNSGEYQNKRDLLRAYYAFIEK